MLSIPTKLPVVFILYVSVLSLSVFNSLIMAQEEELFVSPDMAKSLVARLLDDTVNIGMVQPIKPINHHLVKTFSDTSSLAKINNFSKKSLPVSELQAPVKYSKKESERDLQSGQLCTVCPYGDSPSNSTEPVHDLDQTMVQAKDFQLLLPRNFSKVTCADIDSYLDRNGINVNSTNCRNIHAIYSWKCGCRNTTKPDFCKICADGSTPMAPEFSLNPDITCGNLNPFMEDSLILSNHATCENLLYESEWRCQCQGVGRCNICPSNGSLIDPFAVVLLPSQTRPDMVDRYYCRDVYSLILYSVPEGEQCTSLQDDKMCQCLESCPNVCADNSHVAEEFLDNLLPGGSTCRDLALQAPIDIEKLETTKNCFDLYTDGFMYCGCSELPNQNTCAPCPDGSMVSKPDQIPIDYFNNVCIPFVYNIIAGLEKVTCPYNDYALNTYCGCDPLPARTNPPTTRYLTVSPSFNQTEPPIVAPAVFSSTNPTFSATTDQTIPSSFHANITPIVSLTESPTAIPITASSPTLSQTIEIIDPVVSPTTNQTISSSTNQTVSSTFITHGSYGIFVTIPLYVYFSF